MEYRTYNTGDQIWVRRLVDGRTATVKLITHDGMIWDEENDMLLQQRRLTGLELWFNKLIVATIKFNHWLING